MNDYFYALEGNMTTLRFEPTSSTSISSSGFITTGDTLAVYTTPSQSEVVTFDDGKKEGFSPRIYMKYVKSRFSELERKELDDRLDKMTLMIRAIKEFPEEIAQKALYENVCKALAVATQESEMFVCGYKHYISKQDVDKYKKVADRVVKFESLDKYPRIMPPSVREKVVEVQKRGLFDQFWVLYTDYTEEKDKLKTNKEKIIEKDPIIFGGISFNEDRLYYIIDWEDEHCDLTLDKLIDAIKVDEINPLKTIPEVGPEMIDQIRQEVIDRYKRLESTKPTNWREKVKEEETAWQRYKKKAWEWLKR